MPVYKYKAVTNYGVIVQNKVEVNSKQNLLRMIKENDLMPVSIEQVSYSSKKQKAKKKNIKDVQGVMAGANTMQVNTQKKSSLKEKISMYLSQAEKITNRDIVVFTQNFYMLKKANFNNIHSLKTILESTENVAFKGIIEDILAGVEAGEYMYTTMEYYSDIFPFMYVNMIKVGELSGSMETSLKQAVEYLESSDALKKRVKKIIIPNIIQFLVIFIMLIVGTLIAIPTIQDVYDKVETDAQLPAITLWFQSVMNDFLLHWYVPITIILLVMVAVVIYTRSSKGKYQFDYFKYKMPIFGQLTFSLDFSRFIKAMLLNLNNGMRIQDSMEVSKNIVKNSVFLSIVETSINNIVIGDSWVEPFEKSGLPKPVMTEMLKVGMQSNLAEMMEKLVNYMDMDIDITLQNITKALPEVTYGIVGVILIFFVLVVVVPCMNMYMGNWIPTNI